ERSFMQAAALDPAAAMAYWGIARSAAGDALPAYQLGTGLNRPISPPGPASPEARARDAIDKARALGAKVSDRERLYIEAEASRRNPNAQNPGGDFIRIMHRLIAAYPDDLNAKTILALALENGYDPITHRALPGTLEARTLLKEVL